MNDHRKRLGPTMNQPKTTLSRSRNLKGKSRERCGQNILSIFFVQKNPRVRKIPVSAILGPETAAPILWTPGKMSSFCRKTTMSVKFLLFRGGASADFIFMGARIFLNLKVQRTAAKVKLRRPLRRPLKHSMTHEY